MTKTCRIVSTCITAAFAAGMLFLAACGGMTADRTRVMPTATGLHSAATPATVNVLDYPANWPANASRRAEVPYIASGPRDVETQLKYEVRAVDPNTPFVGAMQAPADGDGSSLRMLLPPPKQLADYSEAPGFDLQSVLTPTRTVGEVKLKEEVGFLSTTSTPGVGASGGAERERAILALEAELGRLRLIEEQRLAAAPLGIRDADEVWIIAKCPPPREQDRTMLPGEEPTPGTGCLVTTPAGGTTPIPLPLRHTTVSANILGYVADVKVTQQFENPYSGKIEAVYVFPLPENAAVSDFVMTVGTRTIRGVIREREQAERIYAQARAQGYVASLLTQERPNIFTQKVANIEPMHRIDITLQYFNTLTYSDGAFEFVYPMVVGPRFNPPYASDGVGAAAQGAPGQSGQQTEVQYIRPDRRSTHDIDVTVTLDTGVELERIECTSHATSISRTGPTTAKVSLSKLDSVPNKDFVLRAHVAGETVKTAVLAQSGRDGGHFTMMVVPPRSAERLRRNPLEVVFVLDASGSMNGRPMEQARAAIERGLARLQPGDTFQLINFAESASVLGSAPIDATPANIASARDHLNRIQAAGGTMMMNGLKASLDFPSDRRRSRYVVFVTDGLIGNEQEILGAIHARLGHTRIFSFGVGSAPNRYLMDAMARMGQGVSAFLNANDSSTDTMDQFFDRIQYAALTDIELDFGRAKVSEVYPSRIPDAFVGRPVILAGRFEGRMPSKVKVSGRVGWERETIEATVRQHDDDLAGRAVERVWARAKITDITSRMAWDSDRNLPGNVLSTALSHNLMSAYTAFVAVDSAHRTDGAFGTTVAVPVPVPEGVRYETTVTEAGVRR